MASALRSARGRCSAALSVWSGSTNSNGFTGSRCWGALRAVVLRCAFVAPRDWCARAEAEVELVMRCPFGRRVRPSVCGRTTASWQKCAGSGPNACRPVRSLGRSRAARSGRGRFARVRSTVSSPRASGWDGDPNPARYRSDRCRRGPVNGGRRCPLGTRPAMTGTDATGRTGRGIQRASLQRGRYCTARCGAVADRRSGRHGNAAGEEGSLNAVRPNRIREGGCGNAGGCWPPGLIVEAGRPATASVVLRPRGRVPPAVPWGSG